MHGRSLPQGLGLIMPGRVSPGPMHSFFFCLFDQEEFMIKVPMSRDEAATHKGGERLLLGLEVWSHCCE